MDETGSWRMWDENGEVSLPETFRPFDPATDERVVTIEAQFTFDGRCEYQEVRIDGELADIAVLPANEQMPQDDPHDR